MSKKKPYSAPELFRVELNQEQAILSMCSLLARNPEESGDDGRFCRMGGCKRFEHPRRIDKTQRPS